MEQHRQSNARSFIMVTPLSAQLVEALPGSDLDRRCLHYRDALPDSAQLDISWELQPLVNFVPIYVGARANGN
jgi:hypothetical protein